MKGVSVHLIVIAALLGLASMNAPAQYNAAPPCGIGTTGTATWSSVPDPPSGERFLWFLVVGDDGGTVEGSWGLTSAGAERGGTLPSGVCGKSTKSTALACLAQ